MATLLSTNFNGSDAAVWPSPWTPLEGSARIVSNRGVITTTNQAWVSESARANQQLTNGTFTTIVRTPTLMNGTSNIDFRYDAQVGNGYRLSIGWYYNGFELQKLTGWSPTALVSPTGGLWQADTDYAVKIEIDGATIRCRSWLNSAQEPSTWQINTTDASYASGDVVVRANSRETAQAMTAIWDDIVVQDTITVVDSSAPTVSLQDPTSPNHTAGYEHISGQVTLQADAEDNIGIQSVEFYDGDPNAGGVLIAAVSSNPYTTTYDTLQTLNGLHRLYAVATDSSGQIAKSAAVDVMINNSGIWVPKNGRAWPVTLSV